MHPTEAQVKAAYLFNFGRFVSWSGERASTGQFQICILGKDPFGEVLDATVRGESIDHKNITVQRLAGMQQAASCNILFVGISEAGRLSSILADAQRMHLLTVSDVRHFAEQGGNIGFVEQGDRVRFEVNLQAAERNHLVLSSELLKVAVKVIAKDSGH